MNYIISQNRHHMDIATVSDSIKDELLSDWDSAYYKILAIMSKIFDENEHVENLDIIFTIKDQTKTYDSIKKYIFKELVIKSAIINNDHFSNVRSHFERNGFKYETL